MSCKVAPSSQTVLPIEWEPLHSSRAMPSNIAIAHPLADSESDLRRTILELQAEIEQARRSGFEEGERKTGEDAAKELRACAERIAGALKDLEGFKSKLGYAAEAEIVRLSLAVARRILHRELMADPESIQGIVHAALQKLHLRDVLRIRTNPALAPSVRAILDRVSAGSNVEISSDPTLRIGDLLFESARGELDASIETQLEEIQRGFADRLARR